MQSICRDLEDLLNTRARCIPWPSAYKNLENSIINFGFDDSLTYNLDSIKAQMLFCQNIEQVIKRFDKRFKAVAVSLKNNGRSSKASAYHLLLYIEATIFSEQFKDILIFDSEFKFDTYNFTVKNR